jgi:hypothetical protein
MEKATVFGTIDYWEDHSMFYAFKTRARKPLSSLEMPLKLELENISNT